MAGHSHGPPGPVLAIPRHVTIRLAVAVSVGFAAAVVGLIVLWPPRASVSVPEGQTLTTPTVNARVVSSFVYDCRYAAGPLGGAPIRCETSQVKLAAGSGRGLVVPVDTNTGPGSAVLHAGDRITVASTVGPTGRIYEFVDYQRGFPLVVLGLLFALFVIGVARWRGLGALVGLLVTWFVLVRFAFPALLEGRDAVAVAVVASALIVCVVLFVAHGVSARTATAVLGTLSSLVLVGVLGTLAVHVTHLTGLSSDESSYLQTITTIRLSGLLLAGMVIGALGVLNDVTVTQASAVWEIHAADPTTGGVSLYRAGIRVGRDHIASTVYTLVLAYAGAALPLLLLFDLGHAAFGQVVTSEVVAEEIVRTLVGSVGLVACVPLTTALAAVVVTSASQTARIAGLARRGRFDGIPTGGGPVPDEDVLATITELAAEEHRLERSAGESGLSADALARLDDLNLRLDQCWDLLRQRRARRNAGLDPTEAEVRDPGVVEGYRQ